MIPQSPRASGLQWLTAQFSRRRFQLSLAVATTISLFYFLRLNFLPTDYDTPFHNTPYARSLSARDLLARPLSDDITTIPKIIHQTWFPAGSNMSENAQAWVQTMREQNPDWEYVLWDDETNRMLVEQYFPWFLTDYLRLPKEIHRADVVRNLYMYRFGGMYADVDTEALRPVEGLFTGHATSLDKHTRTLSGYSKNKDTTQRGFVGHMAHKPGLDGPAAVPNGWMASPPGHPFWLLPVIHVIENPNGNGDGSVESLTGPGALADMLRKYYTESWVFWSNLTILFNKWVIESTEFRYPIILTTWHLIFATLATQLLARTTTMLDGRKKIKMDGRTYLRMIIPIGILYSGSLVCSNIVYLYLNVSFIQMLKAGGPIITLLTTWLWRLSHPSLESFINILIIALAVSLAVAGEVQFSWLGVLFQLSALFFDANRLVMIQILVSDEGQKMDPLVTLYYSAPVCAFTNFLIACATEMREFRWAVVPETGWGVLMANAAVGFMLNVSIFVLIGKTSGLTMTLVSVPKNILLIVCSVLIWGTVISGLQIFGYTIALLGLLYYSVGWQTIKSRYDAGYTRLVGHDKLQDGENV
ncbi:TPT-domain-containing protein [Aspergillus heteromorphus CBS 117.55]|uniref:TPT-domain-containing protein n=1 Tax=Aspergillus heteromorphus CBS 117.55 TaxID=1448321 RepID=A0A317WT85_9EURO|nr:TPT-domain-containing protein [Aspergillus heteromorphus CBS 117.55]PWY87450.1 TPT-domain-containing protein [Aspergillus heteromorphus CBS 117.55]